MILHKLTPEKFNVLVGSAHQISFKENRDVDSFRYNFALVMADDDEMFAYATIIEMDDNTAYMQHGGAMPNILGTTSTKRAYHEMVQFLKNNYKRISTRIQNTNTAMLKLALSEGLIIDGCVCYGSEVFVCLGWGFQNAG